MTFLVNPILAGGVGLFAYGLMKVTSAAASPEAPEPVRHLAALRDAIQSFSLSALAPITNS